eukprot:8039968-Pyramimonas_sp.AAC.1
MRAPTSTYRTVCVPATLQCVCLTRAAPRPQGHLWASRALSLYVHVLAREGSSRTPVETNARTSSRTLLASRPRAQRRGAAIKL